MNVYIHIHISNNCWVVYMKYSFWTHTFSIDKSRTWKNPCTRDSFFKPLTGLFFGYSLKTWSHSLRYFAEVHQCLNLRQQLQSSCNISLHQKFVWCSMMSGLIYHIVLRSSHEGLRLHERGPRSSEILFQCAGW